MKKTVFYGFPFVLLICFPQGYGQIPLQNGWLHFTPSADSRLIYVSDAFGNDATAQYYAPASPEIGADPLHPVGAINSYRTISAAVAELRNGFSHSEPGSGWITRSAHRCPV